jgi:Zn-finger nucleic acid-binding protein
VLFVRLENGLDCPKCTGTLEPITIGEEIHLHRCSDCHGLWCDPDELSRLKSEWMSEALVDTGSPQIGRRLNEVEEVNCPRGHGPMQKRSDTEQSHICYEECETCQGIYLDAGEFTDLKFVSLLDWVKARLT